MKICQAADIIAAVSPKKSLFKVFQDIISFAKEFSTKYKVYHKLILQKFSGL